MLLNVVIRCRDINNSLEVSFAMVLTSQPNLKQQMQTPKVPKTEPSKTKLSLV